ncbi:MAG: hypothetical protein PHR43_02885 [Dehalococcoidales bacterium]|nr:hypothetical protein [Dehalococcoidales bacterium]
MVEIRYGDSYEVAALSGNTVGAARKLFRSEMGIPDKATVKLNGKKISKSQESETIIADTDTITFAQPRGKMALLVGAVLTALMVTGGIFAYGYTTSSVTMGVSAAGADFAAITANTTSVPSWAPPGLFKGTTGTGSLFTVDTDTSGYTGDLVVTVSIANADSLVNAYRVLNMFLEMRDSDGNLVDINGDTVNDTKDYALLTLNNGSVDLFITQTAADTYSINLKSGFYNAHAWGSGGWAGSENPILYAEVAQR